jgi:hypothetical protein
VRESEVCQNTSWASDVSSWRASRFAVRNRDILTPDGRRRRKLIEQWPVLDGIIMPESRWQHRSLTNLRPATEQYVSSLVAGGAFGEDVYTEARGSRRSSWARWADGVWTRRGEPITAIQNRRRRRKTDSDFICWFLICDSWEMRSTRARMAVLLLGYRIDRQVRIATFRVFKPRVNSFTSYERLRIRSFGDWQPHICATKAALGTDSPTVRPSSDRLFVRPSSVTIGGRRRRRRRRPCSRYQLLSEPPAPALAFVTWLTHTNGTSSNADGLLRDIWSAV